MSSGSASGGTGPQTTSTSLFSADAVVTEKRSSISCRVGGSLQACEHLPIAAAAIDHPGAARGGRLDEPPLARQLLEQRPQELPGLTAAEAAEDRMRPHFPGHARHPYALAAGVHVDVVLAGASPLDRDPEDRMGPEHRDARKIFGWRAPCHAARC
jgi:hypothetical protein